MYVQVNHAYLQNWSALSCYLTIAALNDCYSKATALAYSYWASFFMCMDAKVMPTDDTDYSCHIKLLNLFNQSCGVYITPH